MATVPSTLPWCNLKVYSQKPPIHRKLRLHSLLLEAIYVCQLSARLNASFTALLVWPLSRLGYSQPASPIKVVNESMTYSPSYWKKFPRPTTLGCIKPCKLWDKLPTSTGELTGFLNHQPCDFSLFRLGCDWYCSARRARVRSPLRP